MSNESKKTTLKECQVHRQEGVFAVSTPIAGPDGQISKKTPVFHLPMYSVKLKFEDDRQVEFVCDLADMTDLIGKLKTLQDQWIKFGSTKI